MKLSIYQIDTFTDKIFHGNLAAVVPLDNWLDDAVMANIAEENNLAETAFFVANEQGFHIRWFTPSKKEVKLCGHATLASAFVLFNLLDYQAKTITFDSASGPLFVKQDKNLLSMDFPAQAPSLSSAPDELIKGLGAKPKACYQYEDYLAVFEHEDEIRAMTPDHAQLSKLDLRGVAVTAPAKDRDYDFVVRFFAPKYGIPEDPVTGSAYTQLAPYWAAQLKRSILRAKQLSARGGDIICELHEDRVIISGSAILYMQGDIII